MKRYIYSLFIMAITAVAANAQIKPSVQAGINFQNLNGKNVSGDKLENGLMFGYHAGVNFLIPISPEIYFQPGLSFYTKGAIEKSFIPTNPKVRLNYLEVPLNLLYRGQLGDNFVLLGFGPYIGYAISGKIISGSTKESITFRNSLDANTPGGVTYIRAFDAGANIFAGYELAGGIYVTIDASLGLLNINPSDSRIANDKSTLKNTGFGISLGYRF
jgi:hypothetical protein